MNLCDCAKKSTLKALRRCNPHSLEDSLEQEMLSEMRKVSFTPTTRPKSKKAKKKRVTSRSRSASQGRDVRGLATLQLEREINSLQAQLLKLKQAQFETNFQLVKAKKKQLKS